MFCFLFVYVLILWTEKGLHYIYEKSSELCISMTEFALNMRKVLNCA